MSPRPDVDGCGADARPRVRVSITRATGFENWQEKNITAEQTVNAEAQTSDLDGCATYSAPLANSAVKLHLRSATIPSRTRAELRPIPRLRPTAAPGQR